MKRMSWFGRKFDGELVVVGVCGANC